MKLDKGEERVATSVTARVNLSLEASFGFELQFGLQKVGWH